MGSIPIHPLLSQFEQWLGSQGSIYFFAGPEISDNRVEQRLVDIQFGRNSSGRFQIVGSDVIGFANYINRDRIYEHGQTFAANINSGVNNVVPVRLPT
jgi:hypothetical protein